MSFVIQVMNGQLIEMLERKEYQVEKKKTPNQKLSQGSSLTPWGVQHEAFPNGHPSIYVNPVQPDKQELLVSFAAETDWLIIYHLQKQHSPFTQYLIVQCILHLILTYRYILCPAFLFISQCSGQFWCSFQASCCLCNVFGQCLLLCNAVVIGCLELSNLKKQLKINSNHLSVMLDAKITIRASYYKGTFASTAARLSCFSFSVAITASNSTCAAASLWTEYMFSRDFQESHHNYIKKAIFQESHLSSDFSVKHWKLLD